MKRIVFGIGAAGCAAALVLTAVSVPRAAADVQTTQTFDQTARFALMTGDVSTATRDGANPAVQQALFRIDSRTGQVWIYQGCIQNLNRPEVVSAEWVPVRDMSAEVLRRQFRRE